MELLATLLCPSVHHSPAQLLRPLYQLGSVGVRVWVEGETLHTDDVIIVTETYTVRDSEGIIARRAVYLTEI
jgi:hypothetical protein